MENKEDFYKMIEDRKKVSRRIHNSNCIGTTLYLVGEAEEDNWTRRGHTRILNKMKISETPEKGYVVQWLNNQGYTYHLAVVADVNPLKFDTRNGSVPLEENQNFERTNHIYGKQRCFKELKYRVPSKLQKILDAEESQWTDN